nr:carboxypeptidase M32 [Lachnospiraceae bacterium]
MSELFETLRPHLERKFALENALTLYSWDNETLAPKEAMENTAKIIGTLSAEAYRALVNEKVREVLKALAEPKEFDTLTSTEQCIVKKLQKNLSRLEKIPADEYRAFSELTAKAGAIWAKAREDNDFAAFAPTLKEIISYQKKFAAYTKKPEMSLYDAMLDENEEGILTRELDIFFGKIKEEVIPLLKKVIAVNDTVDKQYNFRKFPIEKQNGFCRFLAEYL